jgi:aminomethyltransferase
MVPFAGWDMPVQYDSVLAEARAVRDSAGMFDVSHMARLRLTGARVLEYLEWVTTNDVSRLADGAGQYSLLPNAQGGVVDDVIVYRESAEVFHMVVNAANHRKDLAHLAAENRFGVTIEDNTFATAMIAVQGPSAVEILARLSTDPEAFRQAPTFGLIRAAVADVGVIAARSGYTGEDGYELVCAADHAAKLWQALVAAGVKPCGLAARDTLRVEAGLPLYGHELNEDLSPLAAGLGWVISKTKEFLGSGPIQRARAEGTPRKLLGVRLPAKRLIPAGAQVRVDGKAVGEVTSGVVSVVLECGIGFAFVDSALKPGTACEVMIRDKPEAAILVGKRFLKDRG